MTFWEILFNVVAIFWSPIGITVLAAVGVIALFSKAIDASNYYDNVPAVATFASLATIFAVPVVAFTIWWCQAGYNPAGWHYPMLTL